MVEVWTGSVRKIATVQHHILPSVVVVKVRGDPLNSEG